MGDIGDHWREHKEHKRRELERQSLGMTRAEYAKWQRESEAQWRRIQEDSKRFICSCGKRFKEQQGFECHSKSFGKKRRQEHTLAETKPEPKFEIAF